MWFGSAPRVFLSKAAALEPIVTNSRLTEKGSSYKLLGDWLGSSILTSGGEKWHSRRKLLTPTFHFSILQSFFPVMVTKTHILLDKLSAAVGEPVDIESYTSKCTLDIICQTAMGVDIHAQDSTESAYVSALRTLENTIIYRCKYSMTRNSSPLPET